MGAINEKLKTEKNQDAINQLLLERGRLRQAAAPIIFGVPASDIPFNRSTKDRQAGKININTELERTKGDRGHHGPEGKLNEGFEPKMKTAVEINPSELDNPAEAQGVLFHDVSHREDYELAQQWIPRRQGRRLRRFRQEAGGVEEMDGDRAREQGGN